MKAIVFDEYGDPDVLHTADVDQAVPGSGKIRIRVVTAGINPLDTKIRSGLMKEVMRTHFPAIPGFEIAGFVDAIGDGVTEVAIGDAVLGWSDTGAYAEYAIASSYVRKPDALSWEQAVALPVAGEAANRVLRLLNVQSGETILINGAAGGVGTIAVQLAVARGAIVIGTASEANGDYLRSLGATPVLYGEGLVERVRALAPDGIDAVFDVAGKGALPAAIELRGGSDRIITLADPTAFEHGITCSVGTAKDRSVDDLAELVELVTNGRVMVEIARRFPLADAAEAHRASEHGHHRGKIVLDVGAGI